MNTEANWDLLTKYLAGECTEAEQQQIRDWCQADARNQRLFEHLARVWEQSRQDYSQAQPDSAALWQRLQAGMRRDNPFVAVHVNPQAAPIARPQRPAWQHWGLRIAASILLTLGLGTGVYYWQQPTLITQQTQNQQQKVLTLPDGTRVWLNEGSRLSYPTAFAAERRQVTLEGEAYFEVVHLREHQPFVIQAQGTETTVLGTSFNVTARTSGVQVSVVTGRVRLARSGQQVLLTKGWTGMYDPATQQVRRDSTSDLNFLAWKTGVLTFRNTPVSEVVATLTEYYHHDLRLRASALGTCHFTGTFERQPLDKVLQTLALAFDAKAVTEPGFTALEGGSCQ
ncbi:FecR domain-containing protein [Hymenobacter sp. BT664]|uniref:FecR domain-containing protein n=1 Tax=Hymenobacter montanus TaxID=2771359 RepID=A0A927BAX9_9BACT|nr:FecR domain-containing protein [Hymenobacter montanus]MBD2766950.1 FecR domain-containing protein [Hymenobacter montanus]